MTKKRLKSREDIEQHENSQIQRFLYTGQKRFNVLYKWGSSYYTRYFWTQGLGSSPGMEQ